MVGSGAEVVDGNGIAFAGEIDCDWEVGFVELGELVVGRMLVRLMCLAELVSS